MTKRGALSKAEKFYVQNNPEHKTPKELASELDRSIGAVENAMKEKREKIKYTTTRNTHMDSLLGKKVRNDQVVCTVMTEAASQYTDLIRDNTIKTNQKTKNAIHKPRG